MSVPLTIRIEGVHMKEEGVSSEEENEEHEEEEEEEEREDGERGGVEESMEEDSGKGLEKSPHRTSPPPSPPQQEKSPKTPEQSVQQVEEFWKKKMSDLATLKDSIIKNYGKQLFELQNTIIQLRGEKQQLQKDKDALIEGRPDTEKDLHKKNAQLLSDNTHLQRRIAELEQRLGVNPPLTAGATGTSTPRSDTPRASMSFPYFPPMRSETTPRTSFGGPFPGRNESPRREAPYGGGLPARNESPRREAPPAKMDLRQSTGAMRSNLAVPPQQSLAKSAPLCPPLPTLQINSSSPSKLKVHPVRRKLLKSEESESEEEEENEEDEQSEEDDEEEKDLKNAFKQLLVIPKKKSPMKKELELEKERERERAKEKEKEKEKEKKGAEAKSAVKSPEKESAEVALAIELAVYRRLNRLIHETLHTTEECGKRLSTSAATELFDWLSTEDTFTSAPKHFRTVLRSIESTATLKEMLNTMDINSYWLSTLVTLYQKVENTKGLTQFSSLIFNSTKLVFDSILSYHIETLTPHLTHIFCHSSSVTPSLLSPRPSTPSKTPRHNRRPHPILIAARTSPIQWDIDDLLTLLSDTLHSIRKFGAPNKLTQRFFQTLMHEIARRMVNNLMSFKELCTAANGFQIKLALSKLENWLELKTVIDATKKASKQLKILAEAADVLTLDKNFLVNDDTVIPRVSTVLNLHQVKQILLSFYPDAVSSDMIDTISHRCNSIPSAPIIIPENLSIRELTIRDISSQSL